MLPTSSQRLSFIAEEKMNRKGISVVLLLLVDLVYCTKYYYHAMAQEGAPTRKNCISQDSTKLVQ